MNFLSQHIRRQSRPVHSTVSEVFRMKSDFFFNPAVCLSLLSIVAVNAITEFVEDSALFSWLSLGDGLLPESIR